MVMLKRKVANNIDERGYQGTSLSVKMVGLFWWP